MDAIAFMPGRNIRMLVGLAWNRGSWLLQQDRRSRSWMIRRITAVIPRRRRQEHPFIFGKTACCQWDVVAGVVCALTGLRRSLIRYDFVTIRDPSADAAGTWSPADQAAVCAMGAGAAAAQGDDFASAVRSPGSGTISGT